MRMLNSEEWFELTQLYADYASALDAADWDHIGDRVAQSWEMVAPRRLLEAGGR